MNAAITFNAANFSFDSIHINNITFKVNNTPASFSNSFVGTEGNNGAMNTPGSIFTNSNVVLNDKSKISISNSFVSHPAISSSRSSLQPARKHLRY